MSVRYVFNLASENPKRPLPPKILFPQADTETLTHILLKLFGYLLFFRDRVQVEPRLDDEYLRFTPSVVQLDYEGRVALWVDCGECAVATLDRLAVKAPYAEIWAVKRSETEAAELARSMARHKLRLGRYGIVGLDADMLAEVSGLTQTRNDVRWYGGSFEPARMRFEFNGLWFESEFSVRKH